MTAVTVWRTFRLDEAGKLTAADDYDGGDLVIRFACDELVVPRTAGTFYALPGWVEHEVLPVTAGERWSLVANGHGPMLR